MALGNIHLTPQLIEAVRDAVDIVDIAAEHTRLRKSGRRQTGLCPLHKEKTPSFSLDPEQGLFYCFGCGQGGDAIKLHMLVSGDDFPSAIEALAQRYGIPLPVVRRDGRRGSEERDLSAVLEAATEYFEGQLRRFDEPRQYLARRKIPPQVVERFRLGFAPPAWSNLIEALHPRIPLADLEAAGLVARSERAEGRAYDRFRHRLIFPIRLASGRLVGFGGRALGDDPAKYLNTPETRQFRKGHVLYGLDSAKRAIREEGRILIVEGYFDVLGAVASGIDWSVASMGTALTAEQARLLGRYADEVIVGYDGDAAGDQAFRRSLPLLLSVGLSVRRAQFGDQHDPDSLRLEAGTEAVRQSVDEAIDAVLLEFDRLIPDEVHREPRLQARASREVAALLQSVPDGILRYSYSRRAADRLGIPVELLWRRSGPEASRSTGETAPSSEDQRVVRSLEEKALQLLLSVGEPLPPIDELPPPEVFLEPACRNIYRAFRDVYRDGSGKPPATRSVLSGLAAEGREVDHLARLLLEDSTDRSVSELAEVLGRLTRRRRQQRLRELSSEISQAQRNGDQERLDNLLKEKTDLSLTLHRGPVEKATGNDR
jgi:DNA primase